jgi:hypothetical protein
MFSAKYSGRFSAAKKIKVTKVGFSKALTDFIESISFDSI